MENATHTFCILCGLMHNHWTLFSIETFFLLLNHIRSVFACTHISSAHIVTVETEVVRSTKTKKKKILQIFRCKTFFKSQKQPSECRRARRQRGCGVEWRHVRNENKKQTCMEFSNSSFACLSIRVASHSSTEWVKLELEQPKSQDDENEHISTSYSRRCFSFFYDGRPSDTSEEKQKQCELVPEKSLDMHISNFSSTHAVVLVFNHCIFLVTLFWNIEDIVCIRGKSTHDDIQNLQKLLDKYFYALMCCTLRWWSLHKKVITRTTKWLSPLLLNGKIRFG